MATDYDAPRKQDDELKEDSIEELQTRRTDAQSGTVDEDEAAAAESFELPGAVTDEIRETIESSQLRLMDERGIDLTLFSPRAGFNYDVRGDQKTQVRGGVGIFSGRTPFVWISNQFSNTGVDFARVDERNVGFFVPSADPADQVASVFSCALPSRSSSTGKSS